ncbi:CPBP family intramembrane metalloprotease [Arthrobacter sp. zg-ZUI100]|uniref:CPBP family intramembrane glutamic endopeptidase n=1 Tax=Arthrobacter jiangjiafuii TaxID=2817475 RepID=UPI001AED54DB|nr:CPBP family intramembrane glutamic endopeptidase [Arthrobacter jiangjiafuii]MBP3036879.1 CPBP family intramembrane metalloprotease [Arthrobacter jiangjiafuii]
MAVRSPRERCLRDIGGFTVVLAAVTVPFYVIGPLIGSLSAVTRGNLPGAALAFVCPAAAAAVIAARTGAGGALIRRLALRPRGILPAAAALAVMPAVVAASAVLTTNGKGFEAPGRGTAVLAAVYLVSAATEEIGWTAFLLPRVLQVSAVIPGALLIGVIWALWHVDSNIQAGHTPSWIAGQVCFTVMLRVLMVLIAVGSGGSMWLAALTNASYNFVWSLSPGAGAHYNPWTTALLTAAAAVALYGLMRRMGCLSGA